MSLDHETRIAQLESTVERQQQALQFLYKRFEALDIERHTAGKTAMAPLALPAEVTADARTFDEWSASGYSIIKGQKSTLLGDGRRVFYSSQVRVFVSRAYAAPDAPVPTEADASETLPPDFFDNPGPCST